ncbi:cyclic pyranopterin monophosphate synthase MoaC [Nannocystis pusilla]|uniref:Cyclic pyranopterin monophosphate synthase n=1 Tax=Nannocystis pusilla TaxID=889268 RepID=A0A9X3IV39_9BACT|nr:cyclic pyranopterin monophosphate synthase MoaC [Nannocystis pusilla]MCY1005006.1 cyclic pyranopterin monophosphate synthase MoaC [Nannocystis pusilla]
MAEPLTHFDPSGAARMVAVTDKPETARAAVAEARVRMAPATLERIREGQIGKGDVLAVARLAAIAGAKQTPQLIPLCHPVRLTGIDVDFALEPDLPGVRATVRVTAVDRTGPEMEAMTAAAAAALTIYDMCKAIDRAMAIESVYLVEKSGGKSGVWTRGSAP